MNMDQAMADLEAATTTEHLGTLVLVNGEQVSAVLVNVSNEEAASFGVFTPDGMSVDFIRLTLPERILGYRPVNGSALDINGAAYEVFKVRASGPVLSITLMRYRG